MRGEHKFQSSSWFLLEGWVIGWKQRTHKRVYDDLKISSIQRVHTLHYSCSVHPKIYTRKNNIAPTWRCSSKCVAFATSVYTMPCIPCLRKYKDVKCLCHEDVCRVDVISLSFVTSASKLSQFMAGDLFSVILGIGDSVSHWACFGATRGRKIFSLLVIIRQPSGLCQSHQLSYQAYCSLRQYRF